MINGVDIIFIIPPIALVIIAILAGLSNRQRGAKDSAFAVIKVLAYGGGILLLLFAALLFIYYYAGKGH